MDKSNLTQELLKEITELSDLPCELSPKLPKDMLQCEGMIIFSTIMFAHIAQNSNDKDEAATIVLEYLPKLQDEIYNKFSYLFPDNDSLDRFIESRMMIYRDELSNYLKDRNFAFPKTTSALFNTPLEIDLEDYYGNENMAINTIMPIWMDSIDEQIQLLLKYRSKEVTNKSVTELNVESILKHYAKLKELKQTDIINEFNFLNQPNAKSILLTLPNDSIIELEKSFKEMTQIAEAKNSLINDHISYTKGNSSNQKSSEGCYIATMAYGDYNHPKVLQLRLFRDDVLQKYYLGRLFVKFYYFVSPKLVMLFGDNKVINNWCRKRLDWLIIQLNNSKID